ncbi:MAG TPA: amino acid adenylation domain-containing protein, partial [Thermoanaerobaculia bacterium]|nr:amino acid adenylation domain-containing protein [Thermoanaerobaculia bacterium]
GVVAAPERSVAEVPLLTPEEVEQSLGFERTADFSRRQRLHDLFAAQVERRPEAVAVVGAAGSLSYGELDRRSNRLAHRLRHLGVGPEVRVGLCMDRSIEMLVGIWGILKAGGAYVPLDPTYPEDRLRFLLADSGIAVLVTEAELTSRLPALSAGELPQVLLGSGAALAGESSTPLPMETGWEESLAYVIYTSGSTGQPKGSLIRHSNVTRLLAATAEWFEFGEGDTWTLFHSFAFDFSVWEIFGSLLYGGRLVVVPYWVSRTADAFHDLLERERVTVLNQTPSAFRQLVQADEAKAVVAAVSALRWVIFGGEGLDLASLAPWFERHGDTRPRLVNMYGITETTVHVTFRPVQKSDLASVNRSPLGAAIPDLSLRLLDRRGQPVPLGIAGELHVGGAGLARGYLGRPELTAARFLPDPWAGEPGSRVYASGDLARRRGDGELEYLGRADSQVKIRGFRIEPGEIEAVLARHPAVGGALVVARPDGQGAPRLLAYYLVKGDAANTANAASAANTANTANTADTSDTAPTAEALRAFVRSQLPEHMVPAFFLRLEAFPLTAHGKIDRRALPQPESQKLDLSPGFVAARTPEEEILTRVWAEVLGLARIGIHDNFFTLGGDSILSLRARSLAGRQGLSFSLQDLFQHQTVAELAPHLARVQPETAAAALGAFALLSAADRSALPAEIEDAYPLSQLQLGMLFHSAFDARSVAYHNVALVHLRGQIDCDLLRQALARLAARHPVLRTSFDLGSLSEPLQRVHRQVEIPLTVVDARLLGPAQRQAAAAAWLQAERQRRFDWTQAPLVRFHVQLDSAEELRLGWSEHHAILDGWSVVS